MKPSENDYDWLGWGIYFWESNPQRALEFAIERVARPQHKEGDISEPFVIGAIIKLGHCLDMCDSFALHEVRDAYDDLCAALESENIPIPGNGRTLKMRLLDCAVFNFLHQQRKSAGLFAYDSVMASYREGTTLYPGTDLSHKDHTQICVRSTDSILGYFRPLED